MGKPWYQRPPEELHYGDDGELYAKPEPPPAKTDYLDGKLYAQTPSHLQICNHCKCVVPIWFREEHLKVCLVKIASDAGWEPASDTHNLEQLLREILET